MDFLKINYAILEIYPKGENPSNEEDINDNSKWINIAEIILEENSDILSEDLSMLIDKIKIIFNDKAQIIKNYLKLNYDECALKEFDDCFIDDKTIAKIHSLINNYNISKEQQEIFGVLFNILTIIDFVIENVEKPETMNIIRFVI